MRSLRQSFRLPDRRPAVGVAARPATATVMVMVMVMVMVAACGSAMPELASAPDTVIAGPQGLVGQFVVECDFDRFRADDPIVHPGDVGASHLHQFFGAEGVSARSSDEELLAGETTCDQAADTASYWAPALFDPGGVPIEPLRSVAYYRAGPGVDPSTVVPYPPGFMTVAGDHTALEPQPVSLVAWGCGTGIARSETPLDCGDTNPRFIVTFQDCWNGADARSPLVADPDAHVAFSRQGVCPESHPVAIPQLQFAIDFAPIDPVFLDELTLASGNIYTGHADFWNTWDQAKLANEVERCIHRDLVCGVSG